ncbi:MAG: adenosylcobinamide-GDP ribazoletransferase, partial [Phreatobacter sp.]
GAVSRTVALGLQVRLPPARVEGVAYATGMPREADWYRALAMAAAIAILAVPAGGVFGVICGLGVAGLLLLLAIRFADSHVGGQTGDITGATQQVIEIGMLLALLASAAP